KCICLSPHQIALTIGSTATIINPRTTALIVVNHWQFYHTSTLPLATLYNSLNFPESIAINYRGPSHNRQQFDWRIERHGFQCHRFLGKAAVCFRNCELSSSVSNTYAN